MRIRTLVGRSIGFIGDVLIRIGSPPKISAAPKISESHQIVIPAAGVTFEGRQDVIRGLVGDEHISFITDSAGNRFPYRIQIRANGVLVGYVSDKKFGSNSRSFYDLWKEGYVIKAIRYQRVMGTKRIIGMRIVCSVER